MPANAAAPAPSGRTSPLRRLASWYDRRRSGSTVVIAWLVTRLLVLAVLAVAERFVVGDVFYYHRKIRALFDVGLSGTLNEYPTPVTWILWLPYGLGWGTAVGYLIVFVALMMALDAVFTLVLYRSAGRRHTPAVDFWLLFVLLVGPLSYLRFDVLPAVLAGGALLALRRRPALAGALTGLGAAVKLWPALLVGALLAPRRTRRPVAVGFVVVGFGLALVSLLAGGATRLFSPLTWQSDRGLQIESVWATPLMLARAVAPGWSVGMSRYQAFEVFGPGTGPLLLLSDLATVGGLVVIGLLLVRAFRSAVAGPVGLGLVMLATVAVMTVTNKTLSPQYLLWLGGPMAALLVLRSAGDRVERRTVGRLAVQLLVLALLTHLVYPLLYDGFLGRWGAGLLVVATVVTAVRNLALVLFAVVACRLAWVWLGRPPREAQAGAALADADPVARPQGSQPGPA